MKSSATTTSDIQGGKVTWVRVPRFDIDIPTHKITWPIRLRLLFVKSHKSFDAESQGWCIVKYKVYKHKTYVLKVRQGDV